MNQFGDLNHQDFSLRLKTLLVPQQQEQINFKNAIVPDYLDYRTLGVVPNVINQGECTSSIFFAEGMAIQCAYALHNSKFLPLSYAQLIACTGDGDCDHFRPVDAYDYIAVCGAPTKFNSDRKNCHYDVTTSVPVIDGVGDVIKGNETDLALNLFQEGPLTVGVDASHPTFQFYSGGIYYEPDCRESLIDHLMLLVGFSQTSAKYWILQNSWGAEWGLQGYMLMSKDRNNHCGISSMAKYPVYGTKRFKPDERCY